MTGSVAPEPHWGRDDSDSLILDEQAKSLPAGLETAEADQARSTRASVDQDVLDRTGKSPAQILALLQEAEQQGKTYIQAYVAAARERSYKAFRNEHFRGSKYESKRWSGRSKVFKPKTRGLVRRKMASAAAALFSTQDVLSVTPEDNSNPQQAASAALKQALINYRLDRSNGRNSIAWFLVAMGASQDADITGICISKQFWKFRERTAPTRTAGQPVTMQTAEKAIIVFDRPDCLNIPPENVVFDPNCEWTRPAQTSSYWIVRYPMAVHDVRDMMKASGASNTDWLEVSDTELNAASASPDDTTGTRGARTGGADPIQHATSSSFRPIWVYENFLRLAGEDWHFWTIGTSKLLSLPTPTRDVYPAFHGDRPYVMGFGAIETHRSLPMSPVESVQPLQQEANDMTNLRLDLAKQVVSPLAKVKRGRQVDIDVVQRRAHDTVVLVNDMEDVDWDRPPEVPRSAYEESAQLNNDFDELAGSFSASSVASNRQLNETVGGMKLLSGAANGLTEFDLRIWVETWVEPVLWQLVKLEEYYEDDAKVLALAGNKADLVQLYGIDEVTDSLLMDDVTVRCSVGIGSSDPIQSLEKFAMAGKIAGELLMPFIMAGKIDVTPNTKEIIDEIFGKAGFKNAGERFFSKLSDEPAAPPPGAGGPPPDPAAMAKVQLEGARLAQDAEKAKGEQALKAAALAQKDRAEKIRLMDRREDRESRKTLAILNVRAKHAADRMKQIGNDAERERERKNSNRMSVLQSLIGEKEREHQHELGRDAADQAHHHAKEQAKAKPKPESRTNG